MPDPALPEARVVKMPARWRVEKPQRCCCGRRIPVEYSAYSDVCCHGASHCNTCGW